MRTTECQADSRLTRAPAREGQGCAAVVEPIPIERFADRLLYLRLLLMQRIERVLVRIRIAAINVRLGS